MNINLKKWSHKIPNGTVAIEISGTHQTAQKNYDLGLFNCWDSERIKNAFRFGNGTINDFKRYINLNKKYCTIIFVG